MKKDIDLIIDSIHDGERYQYTVDFPEKYDDVSLAVIFSDIHKEGLVIKTDKELIMERVPLIRIKTMPAYLVQLKKIAQKVNHIAIFRNKLIPLAKRVLRVGESKTTYYVDGKELLKCGDDEFIDEVYRAILQREPGEIDRTNIQSALFWCEASKVDIIQHLLSSPECAALPHRVIVKGIKGKKIKARVAAKGRTMPIIGRLFRWIHAASIQPRLIAYVREAIQRETQLEEQAARDADMVNRFYLRYNEVIMQDTREEVKKRESIYLPYLFEWSEGYAKSDMIMYDLGCGTGEWVELLNGEGYPVAGVDSNNWVVEKVKTHYPHITIFQEEAYAFLLNQADNSIDFLSAFHMIEHIDFVHLLKFLKECHRVLRKGGMLVLETPNPQNILTATFYFNLDPTHLKPIPPELLAFYLEESGFTVKEKLMNSPLNFAPYDYKSNDSLSDIIFRFNMEQTHGAVAVKK